ncbi:MAG TPA: dihydromethanopterin reductase (acceptor) [Candidatus Acidoferrales bacterium]|nr:dihydromethanopterin reductase (acceptor) [Candidatus Acidoferrales bacterium]
MKIAWGVTGAGHYLKDSFDVFTELKSKFKDGVKITTFVSKAAEEVTQVYGLFKLLGAISPGGYMEEIILESQQGWSYPKTGRFSQGKYDALVVAPATSNTVAKIVHGIADSLVTNAVAHGIKGGVPVYIVPVDIEGKVRSPMPYFIDREICVQCGKCVESCPNKAIEKQIDFLKCQGCGLCRDICEYNAIKGGYVELRIRDVDTKNVKEIRNMEGIDVLETPNYIVSILHNIYRESLKLKSNDL